MDLVRHRKDLLTGTGNVSWTAVAKELGVNYESLRKALVGERMPPEHLMEKASRTFGVTRDYFVEAQLLDARREFDITAVGWDRAIANLEVWRLARGDAAVEPASR
jgi:hypothetical protein